MTINIELPALSKALLVATAILISSSAAAAEQINASPSAQYSAQYSGSDLYMLNCSNCHGVYGEGDGAVTPDLSVVLLDLRYLSARSDGIFPADFVREIVDGRITRSAHGPHGMPVWGAEFARSEGLDEAAADRVNAKIDAVVHYLESTQIVD